MLNRFQALLSISSFAFNPKWCRYSEGENEGEGVGAAEEDELAARFGKMADDAQLAEDER